MFNVPVAFIVFNRPDATRRTFEVVRQVRPRELFVISDGPRLDCVGETELVREVREIVSNIDWPCSVTKLYSDHNLGCGRRISSGLRQALEQVDSLIVLEDDCLVEESFFEFTAELLDRYAHDPRVMSIAGACLHDSVPGTSDSYYFSKYAHPWGWATWRRAWQTYEYRIENWSKLARSRRFAQLFDNDRERLYWTHVFDRVERGKLDTWDFQWCLACWLHGGLTAVPTKNLVSNIGFTADATHTVTPSRFASLPITALGTLQHPQRVARNVVADQQFDAAVFSGTWRKPHSLKLALNRLRREVRSRRAA